MVDILFLLTSINLHFYIVTYVHQVQCNVFDGFSGEVALTAGGGRRGLPLLKDTYEDVAMVSLNFAVPKNKVVAVFLFAR